MQEVKRVLRHALLIPPRDGILVLEKKHEHKTKVIKRKTHLSKNLKIENHILNCISFLAHRKMSLIKFRTGCHKAG